APTRSPCPCPFLRTGGCPSRTGDQGGGTLAVPDLLAHPSGTPETVPAPPPASTSSASRSAPLPTSAMFLLRLPPPKNQTGSSGPAPFLGSRLSPAPVREEGGGPALRPGPGRGQRAAERVLSPPPAPADPQSIHFPSGRGAAGLAASSAPLPASPRPPTRLKLKSQPGSRYASPSPAGICLGPPCGRGQQWAGSSPGGSPLPSPTSRRLAPLLGECLRGLVSCAVPRACANLQPRERRADELKVDTPSHRQWDQRAALGPSGSPVTQKPPSRHVPKHHVR
ncbi:unnamed protein product, partial [Gulo gulo]